MRVLLFAALVGLVSCQKPSTQNQGLLFNVDSLINYQINSLQQRKPVLHKLTVAGDELNETVLENTKVDWAKELEMFRVISVINKPIYRSAYAITITPDIRSNLTVKSWTAIQDVPVRIIKVYYLDDPHQIRRLEVYLKDENFVFSSHRTLKLLFGSLESPPQLQEYSISVYQKFVWDMPHNFSLRGQIQQ
jgi:hypothetical protein